MTRINHKIDKNHPNNIFFSFFTQFIPNFERKRLKKGPPSASGHFWEFFRFFCANHLRNTFSSLYQQAGKIGKNVHFIDIPTDRKLLRWSSIKDRERQTKCLNTERSKWSDEKTDKQELVIKDREIQIERDRQRLRLRLKVKAKLSSFLRF